MGLSICGLPAKEGKTMDELVINNFMVRNDAEFLSN